MWRWVQPGDRVEKGDPLTELNTDSVKTELREAQAADIRAQEELAGVLNWQTGIEMTAAQRQVFSAQSQAQAAEARLAESQALFDKGIVARSELDRARFELASATEQLQNAKDGLASTAQKGGASQLQLARLGAESSSAKLRLLQDRLKAATLTAPIAGQVFKPVRVDTAAVKELEVGTFVASRDVLMMIGDTTQHMVRASLDEFDVARVKPGLPVEVSLNTDDKVLMPGEVVRVSAQARTDQRMGSSAGVPMFDIEVVIRKVPPELKPRLRLGMTTRLRMVAARQPSALTVPLAAVRVDSNGRSTVIRRAGGDRKDDGKGEETMIETGATMADRIVVLKGLAAGDAVWVPPNTSTDDATAQATSDKKMDSLKSVLPV